MTDSLGATGRFPREKIHATDEGEIRMSVGTDPARTVVIVNFGSPVTWLGMPYGEAVALGEAILRHAGMLRGVDSGGVPREPSEAAIEAAREASGEARGTPDNLLGRRVVLAVLRAAYAVDRLRDSGGVAPAAHGSNSEDLPKP